LDFTLISSAISLKRTHQLIRTKQRTSNELLQSPPLISELTNFRQQDSHLTGERFAEIVDISSEGKVVGVSRLFSGQGDFVRTSGHHCNLLSTSG
jgi:hypothetical protein